MKISAKLTLSLGLIFFCHFLLPNRAFAYIDPGTGSYVLQVLLAAFFAGAYALKVFWTRISTFFNKVLKFKKDAS